MKEIRYIQNLTVAEYIEQMQYYREGLSKNYNGWAPYLRVPVKCDLSLYKEQAKANIAIRTLTLEITRVEDGMVWTCDGHFFCKVNE